MLYVSTFVFTLKQLPKQKLKFKHFLVSKSRVMFFAMTRLFVALCVVFTHSIL